MTVYNGVLVIHFRAPVLLTTMSFTGNLVTGFPSMFTVDLWRVEALHILAYCWHLYARVGWEV